MNEPLDFCRVKNIHEKGYGFLKSINYPGDIFFHFSIIKKEVFLEKLKNLQRGDFFLFFQSEPTTDNKRKIKKFWYTLEDVPKELLSPFANKIIEQMNDGKFNIYDLLFAFDELRKLNSINEDKLNRVMTSQRIMNMPSVLLSYLSDDEKILFKEKLNIEQYKDMEKKPFWYEELL